MTTAPETLRAFIALPLPPDWTHALAEAICQLRRSIPAGVRWADPSGIHLTLKFLGPTDANAVPGIVKALIAQMASATPPLLSLSGLGTFPAGRNPRVLWAGVSGDLAALQGLQQRAEAAAAGLGWPPEKRPFRPHLTLGRVRDHTPGQRRQAIAQAVANANLPPATGWQPHTVRLYRSVLTPRGAIYTSLGEVAI